MGTSHQCSALGGLGECFDLDQIFCVGVPRICSSFGIDACSALLVKRPWDFDVMVMENMFGDILSDMTAGLIGGMGMAPSADIGDCHAVFQPCHGTAPDIMGQGKANPTGMILSTAMMLDWLADKHGLESAAEAGERIERAVDKVYADGIRPMEFGGRNGTADIARAVLAAL